MRRLGPGGVAPDLTGLLVAEAALAWAEAGFYVFPCEATGFDPRKRKWSKRPHHMLNELGAADGEGGWKLATQVTEIIVGWWARDPQALIGIPPGMSGAVVLDADGPDGVASLYERGNMGDDSFDLTTTFQSRTPGDGGGLHVWFQKGDREKLIGNGRLSHIRGEARGDRGYVIAPNSVLPDGGTYTVASDTRVIAELPGWAAFELPWEDRGVRRSIADITTGAQIEWLHRHSAALFQSKEADEMVAEAEAALRGSVFGDEQAGRDPTMKHWVGRLITEAQNGMAFKLEEALARVRDVFTDVKPGPVAASDFDRFVADALALRVSEEEAVGLAVDLRTLSADEEAEAEKAEQIASTGSMSVVATQVSGAPLIPLPSHLRLYEIGDISGVIEDPDDAVKIGPIGRWLDTVLPQTEATLSSLGMGLLTALGAWYGRDYILRVGAIEHPLRLFGVQVGPTATARKGTADGVVRRLLDQIDPGFVAHNIASGFGSGEGLILRISDPRHNATGAIVSGTTDQRLLIQESEFSKQLRLSERDGSILGDVIRLLFDGRDPIDNITVTRRVRSSSHAVSIFGGITPEELITLFPRLAAVSGTGNRYLWVWSHSTNYLPAGGTPASVAHHAAAIRVARRDLGGPAALTMTNDAMEWWRFMYQGLRDVSFAPPVMRPMVTRTTDQLQRIAAIYALTEGLTNVDVRHLEAGLAWIKHSVNTVSTVMGGLVSDEIGTRILASLRRHPGVALTLTELHRVFGRNETAAVLRSALNELETMGLVYTWAEKGKPGRPTELTVATTPLLRGKSGINFFVPPLVTTGNGQVSTSDIENEKNTSRESVLPGNEETNPHPTSDGLDLSDLDLRPAGDAQSPPPPDMDTRVADSQNDSESGSESLRCPDCGALSMHLTADGTMLFCEEPACLYSISVAHYQQEEE